MVCRILILFERRERVIKVSQKKGKKTGPPFINTMTKLLFQILGVEACVELLSVCIGHSSRSCVS